MRLLMLCLLWLPLTANAAEPELRGQFKNWTTYRYDEASGPVCYAMVRSTGTTDTKGKKLKIKGRGQVLLQITRRPHEGGRSVLSFVSGHRMKKKSEVNGYTDKGKFVLRADGDSAWTANPSEDASVVSILSAGNWLRMSHQDKKGNVINDAFSLAGSTAALQDIAACN